MIASGSLPATFDPQLVEIGLLCVRRDDRLVDRIRAFVVVGARRDVRSARLASRATSEYRLREVS